MEFIKYNKNYYEIYKGKYFNYHDGYINIPRAVIETTPVLYYDSWHELYKATGYAPNRCSTNVADAWVAPDGTFYEGRAHAVEAEYIVEIIYGLDLDLGESEDYLREHGWVKVTTSLMSDWYEADGMYKNLTRAQYEQINIWNIENHMDLRLEEPIC